MSNPTEPKHPGKIVFVDGATQQVTQEVDAETVPLSIRFAETDKGLVPVVKIVSFMRGEQQIIRSYGPDNEFLTSTVRIPTGKPPQS